MSKYDDAIPMVSILMLAYNHEKYIEKALNGILMQKVNFTYEIVIGEDCSQDSTRDILLTYKENHPEKIKLILHKNNVGMNRNASAVRRHCKGKYIAICEGDDYWTDPYKLKKQVDFLENNPNYIGTAHEVEVVDEFGKPKSGHNSNMYCKDTIYTIRHSEKGLLPGQSATLVYRNILASNPKAAHYIEECKTNDDMKIALFLALYGNVYCFNDVMSHYRWVTTEGSSWSARTRNRNMNLYIFNSFRELEILARKLRDVNMDYSRQYLGCGLGAFKTLIKSPNIKNLIILGKVYKQYNNKMEMTAYILKRTLLYPFKHINKNIGKIKY